MITVYVVDDHDVVQLGLRTMLDATDDLRFLGASSNLAEAVAKVAAVAPDIVILDLFVGREVAWDLCRRLSREATAPAVVIFSGHGNAQLLAHAMDCGARGYLLKDTSLPLLPAALRDVAAGGQWWDPALLREWRKASARHRLFTEPEIEIIKLIAAGADNFQIAEVLCVSTHTVKYHIAKALKRSGESNRAGLVRRAIELDLMGLREEE